MLNQLSRYTSFANAIRATAAIAGGLLLCANLTMRTAYPETRRCNVLQWSALRDVMMDQTFMVSVLGYIVNIGAIYD